MNPVFETACAEATQLSFAVGVEHLVLACAVHGALDVDPEALRERIVDEERSALATFGISFDDVHAAIGNAGCFPVEPDVKQVLERAGRNATPTQVLATLREHSARARRLLDEAG